MLIKECLLQVLSNQLIVTVYDHAQIRQMASRRVVLTAGHAHIALPVQCLVVPVPGRGHDALSVGWVVWVAFPVQRRVVPLVFNAELFPLFNAELFPSSDWTFLSWLAQRCPRMQPFNLLASWRLELSTQHQCGGAVPAGAGGDLRPEIGLGISSSVQVAG